MLPSDIDTGCNRSQGGSHGSDPTIGNCCAAMIAPPFSLAASAMDQVTVGYSACCSGEKICLELKAIDPGRVRPQQLLASGEVPFVIVTGTGALISHILGVKDQAIILTFINKVNSGLFTRGLISRAPKS